MMKSKKKLKKAWREKYKDIHGNYPEPKFMASNGTGRLPRYVLKGNQYTISNQKGAFGIKMGDDDDIVYETFSETNHERHVRKRKIREQVPVSIVDGAKMLLARTLGE